jgi:hypothetical protein
MTSPLVIEASGSHREVGRQVGEAGRDIIAWGLDRYAERFEALAGSGAPSSSRSRQCGVTGATSWTRQVTQTRA